MTLLNNYKEGIMHFTETVYRNPYWPTFPLLQITHVCTHNKCKFCSMYKDVDFRLQPLEWVEEDLKEIAEISPDQRQYSYYQLIH